MTVSEFFVKRFEAEQPAFLNVLKALNTDQLDYKPHERSMSAGDLAWQLAIEQRVLAQVFDTEVAWPMEKRPATLDAIVAEWEKSTAALRQKLEGFNDEKAATSATIKMGDNAWTDKLGDMLWGFLFDMIHHRGQLSTYIRPTGGKVPAIYGPSGDSAS